MSKKLTRDEVLEILAHFFLWATGPAGLRPDTICPFVMYIGRGVIDNRVIGNSDRVIGKSDRCDLLCGLIDGLTSVSKNGYRTCPCHTHRDPFFILKNILIEEGFFPARYVKEAKRLADITRKCSIGSNQPHRGICKIAHSHKRDAY